MKNNKGMTILEIVVGVGLSSILLLAIFQLVSTMGFQNRSSTERNEFENDLARSEFFIERVFRTAVRLSTTTANIASTALPGTGLGQIWANFDSTDYDSDGTTRTLAIFFRETSNLNAGDRRSVLTPTGVYFKQPEASKYGALYIDMGLAGSLPLEPDNSDTMLTRLTEFEISYVPAVQSFTATQTYLKSATIRFVLRVPSTVSERRMIWCSAGKMGVQAGCITTEAPYKDVTRTLTIRFPNNLDITPGSLNNGFAGRVYFLR